MASEPGEGFACLCGAGGIAGPYAAPQDREYRHDDRPGSSDDYVEATPDHYGSDAQNHGTEHHQAAAELRVFPRLPDADHGENESGKLKGRDHSVALSTGVARSESLLCSR